MGDNPYKKSPAFATAEEYQSSSEYSSREGHETPSPANSSRLGATENNETGNNHNRVHSDDWRAANAVWRRPESSKTRNDHQEDWGAANAAWRRPPSPGADGYPTSEESRDEDRGPNYGSRHDMDRIANHSRGSPTKGRGKKGLTHAEMAIMGRGGGELEGGNNDADNYHYTDENGRVIDGRSSDVRDEGDDTEEAEDSDEMSQRSTDRESSKAKAWSECHPVVLEAVRILNAKSADPAELGYARLASAGKGAVDYIVRKRSITIGRSASTSDCTIKSEGRYISRRHAMLFWKQEEKEWAIRCLSDKNGILVNGVPVVRGSDSIPVKSRDLIEVGDVAFFFLAATSPVVRINSITALDRTIRTIQQGEDYDRSEYFHAKKNDLRTVQQKGLNTNRIYDNERKKRAQDKSKLRLNVGRLDGFSGTKKRRRSTSSGGLGDAQHLQKSQKRWKKSQKAKNRAGLADNASIRESDDDGRTDEDDPDVTEEEEEDAKQKTWLDEKANRGHGSLFGSTSLRPQQDLMSTENKEEIEEAELDENWHLESPPSKYRNDWNKKERTDFGRALFAVGVDPVYDDDGSIAYYDWARFRKIAGLSKKSDLMLENYYINMMTDVHSLLEEEEQEKRTKGPRTKHKPGCDCVVCENTRKSRRKKREERENSAMNELPEEESDGEDEAAVKSSAKSSDKLVGLVTAQKLRVRLSIHDAARQVLNGAGKALFKKLSEQPVRGFPRWWRPGIHDKALMRGTAIHGVAQWSNIWNDPNQKVFRKQKEEDGDAIVWPSNQAAMKRVRDISSGINAELRREAKRAAKDDHVSGRDVYYKQNRHKRTKTAREEKAFQRRKKASRRSNLSADEYEDVMSDGGENGDGESTVESAAEMAEIEDQGQGAADVPTEDDDVLEMEVEEEMEIEDNGDNGDNGEETEEESSKGQAVEKPIKARSNVGDNWTDEEEDDEDVIQYETASDSGSE